MYDKNDKSWYAKQDNAQRKSFSGCKTQEEAVNKAKEIAQNKKQELSIHRKDNNQIREKIVMELIIIHQKAKSILDNFGT